MKRILHISSKLEGGGAAVVFKTTYNLFLNDKKYENYIASTDVNNSQFQLNLQNAFNGNLLKRTLNYLYSYKNKKLLNNFLIDKDIDVIHIHSYLSNLSPSILSSIKKYKKTHKVKIIQTLHEFHLICPNSSLAKVKKQEVCEKCIGKRFKCYPIFVSCSKDGWFVSVLKWFRYLIYGRLLRVDKIVDKFICVSDFQKRKFEKDMPKSNKFITVSNPVDNSVFNINDFSKKNQIIYYGRLSREKNLELLIHAFSLLISNKEYSDYKLLIIGKGDEENTLKRLAEKLLNARNYQFVDFIKQEELLQYIAESKVSVVPSQWYETFGLTIVESLLCHTIPLVSDLGALKDTIDNTYGFSFQNNNVKDLLKQIVYILSDFSLVQEKIKKEYNKVLEYSSIDKYKSELEKIYFN